MFGGMKAAGRAASRVRGLLDDAEEAARQRAILEKYKAQQPQPQRQEVERRQFTSLLDEFPIDTSPVVDYPADAVSLGGVHYGNVPGLSRLAGRMWGTGARGREAERVRASGDPRLQDRVYFYGDRGDGLLPRPEPVVMGGHVYDTRASGLYVPGKSDPEVIKRARSEGQFDPNAFERALLDAGYAGYFTPDSNQMVLLGRGSVPVRYLGPRQALADKIRKGP